MKSKKRNLLIGLGVSLMITLGIGMSYAYWLTTKTQETANAVTTGCFSTTFTDKNNISLTNQFPITDANGLKTSPYTFTITNTCTINAKYQINLETLNTSTLGLSHVKLALNIKGQKSTPRLLSNIDTNNPILTEANDARNLGSGYLDAGESKTFELRIWVDESTTEVEGENKGYSSKIVVSTAASDYAYKDASGAASPELYQGLIPVTYDTDGNMIIADPTVEWFSYEDHNWANAVLVNCNDSTIKSKYFDDLMNVRSSMIGQIVSMDDVLEMYVWIPRYKYLLWNAANGSSDPQAISIVFEDKLTPKSSGSTNGTYLTHPAFTFGDTELNGIWVGKFENSGTTSNLTIKPNLTSLTSINVGTMFNTIRGVETNTSYGLSSEAVDTHMMKNMEWGAVAYLSSSIYGRYTNSTTCISSGCEVWINNVNTGYGSGTAVTGVPQYGPSITGCAGSSTSAGWVSSMTACASGYDWKALGVNASTTGNQYGAYDMSGGAWEYVMGNMSDSSGNFYSSSAGLTQPDTKYYDSYAYSASSYTDHARGKLGDATKETLKTFGSEGGGWYGDYASLPYGTYSWFGRGGSYSGGTTAGLFSFRRSGGGADSYNSFRSVLSAQ